MSEKEFAAWLEGELNRQGMTRNELSTRSGVTPVTIRHYLREMRSPKLSCMTLILNALGKKLVIVDKEG